MTSSQQETTCWWHPKRTTGLRCARCERFACTECLHEAPVGYQCDECVREARRYAKQQATVHRRAGFGERTVAGAIARERVVVTPVLIVLNVLVYVATAVQTGDPMDNHSSSPLFAQWVLSAPDIAVSDQWWRLVTSGFLHIGPLHIAVNMLALWFVGRDLERLLGWWRFAALYALSLLGGSVAVYLFDDVSRTTAGASGAVYGILGGVLVAVLRMRLNPGPVIATIVFNLAISISLASQISLLGHVGGLVTGVLVTAALVYAPARRRALLQVTVMIAVVAALVAMTVVRDGPATAQACQIPANQSWCAARGVD